MSGCSMALRYDDRGSNFSKPYYNGKSGGGNASGGRDRGWNNAGGGGARHGNDFREATSTSADHHPRKYDRRDAASAANRSQENWDERSSAEDSDKAPLRQFGDWTEQLSSAGKKYYYNCRTEVSQWEKPSDWIAWEKRSGAFDQDRKRRAERSVNDDQISPSHSSAGRPSSSRDQNQNSQQWKGGVYDDDNAVYDNACGRNYGNQSRRPYANNTSAPNRSNDFSRGTRSKYDARGGHFLTNRPSFDGQQSRYDQHAYASTSGADRGGTFDHRDRSKRPLIPTASTSREVESEDSSMRERSPKRSKPTPAEHGSAQKNGPDKRSQEQLLSSAAAEDDDDNVTANVQIDMERLPHLLVEIAEKNNIDLSDPDALEKIKRHLKTALCNELNSTPLKNDANNCHFAAVSDDDEEIPKAEEQQPASGTGHRDEFIDEQEEAQPADSAEAMTQESMAGLFNEELVAHVRGWSAGHFEVQASHLSNASFHISLDVSHISADLKCARSLVRTAEIRSTLLEQRIAYLRQQYHELETMSKPNASGAVSALLTSS